MPHILIATLRLDGRTGTEVVCIETAQGLRRRGHLVTVFAQTVGASGAALRDAGVSVVTDLRQLATAPDVIQSNQTYPLLEALATFPRVPAISICHDAFAWFNEPVDHPSIRRHLAVDLASRDRIESALPGVKGQIRILHNAVDLSRFVLRTALPARPERALLIAKQALAAEPVRDACARRGIALEVLGPDSGNVVDDLAERLRGFDIVLASARSLLEALAVGCAGILVDGRGFGGPVTSDVVTRWRENNFGARLLSHPVTEAGVLQALDAYSPAEARRVTDLVRRHSSLDAYLDELEAMLADLAVGAPGAGDTAAPTAHDLTRAYRSILAAQERFMEMRLRARLEEREADHQARERRLADDFEARLSRLHDSFVADFDLREQRLTDRFKARVNEVVAEHDAKRASEAKAARDELQAYRAWVAPGNLHRRIAAWMRRSIRDRLGRQ
jgi:hypothetical protein